MTTHPQLTAPTSPGSPDRQSDGSPLASNNTFGGHS